MKKIQICDSIMGSGKTSAAIRMMKCHLSLAHTRGTHENQGRQGLIVVEQACPRHLH